MNTFDFRCAPNKKMPGIAVLITVLALALTLMGCSSTSKTYEVGETATTDSVEFTLTEVRFTDKLGLDYDNWLKPNNGTGGLTAGDGNTYVWFSFKVKNISKSDLSGYDVCKASIDYDDGHVYDDADYSTGPKWTTKSSVSKNVGLPTIQSLEEKEFYGYIKCVDDVRENRDKALLIKFELPSSNKTKEIIYSYMPSADAVTSDQAKAVSDTLNAACKELDFVKKYAGNTNNNGSRKFADSKVESIRNCTSNIDMDYVNKELPETAAALPTVNNNISTIVNYLEDMGATNSDANVSTMKTLASDTISLIDEILQGELKAFN